MKANMHGDHIASCLCCEKLTGSLNDRAYSDVTPGEPGQVYCTDGEFFYNGSEINLREVFEMIHRYGMYCEKFEARE